MAMFAFGSYKVAVDLKSRPVAEKSVALEADHDSFCSCGTMCRKSECCCRPKQTKHESEPLAKAEPIGLVTNPCVTVPPQGDPILPGRLAIDPSVRVDAWVMAAYFEPTGLWASLCDRAVDRLPDRRASRLDRPPDLA